jgi:membrane-bound serine protease (ClpP class)
MRQVASTPVRLLFRCLTVLSLSLSALLLGPVARGDAPRPIVYVVPIKGEIDAGLAPFVERAAREASEAGAAALLVDIDTLGGRVDAALVIRDALVSAPMTTLAFVHPRAISAGALIALAAEKIAMSDGATIGAAAPILVGPRGGPEPAGEKVVSYLRKEFRTTAELRGRRADVAEAMVDEDVAIPGVIEKGKLLTATTREALSLGVADFQANDVDSVLARVGLSDAEVRRASPNWAEGLVRILTRPAISSLLLTLGTLGLLIELRTPGFGVPGLVGGLCLALFLWSHALLHLVGWEEIALIGGGLLLLLIEVFVTPGFGVAGVLGIIALVAGLSLSLVGAGVTLDRVLLAIAQTMLSVFAAFLAALALLRFLPRLPFGRSLVLATGLQSRAAPPETHDAPRVRPHDRGVTLSPLRPSGIGRFAGERLDVISDGEYIPAGEPIAVVRVDGNRVVVRRAGVDGRT